MLFLIAVSIVSLISTGAQSSHFWNFGNGREGDLEINRTEPFCTLAVLPLSNDDEWATGSMSPASLILLLMLLLLLLIMMFMTILLTVADLAFVAWGQNNFKVAQCRKIY